MARPDSEDGWRPPRLDPHSPDLHWVIVPGTNPPVHLQIMTGWPTTLLLAFAADLNEFVERMRDNDSCCYTPTNTVATSNHLNATCFDYNWNSHPFHVFGTFNAAQMATLAELFDFYTIGDVKLIAWGGKDWGGNPQDEMHFQMGYNTWNNPLVGEFIRTKIRADGFSTFRRGGNPGVPVPQPTPNNAVTALWKATGITAGQAERILGAVVNGLRESQCTNVNRIAMWLAQIGHESDNFNATEEYDTGANHGDPNETTDRWRYKGRTWIQITWPTNYAGFSKWCLARHLVPSATYFVDRPKELAQLQWAGLGAAWYWTVARPGINAMCDAQDLLGVTRAINGGLNGLEDSNGQPGRRTRYNRALALGDQLLALTTTITAPPPEEDWLTVPTNQEKLDAIYNALFTPRPPENIYRQADEVPPAAQGQNMVDSVFSLLSMVYEAGVERLGLLGEKASQDKVVSVAKGQAIEQRPWAIDRANLIWTRGKSGQVTAARIADTEVATVTNVSPTPVADLPALLPAAELPKPQSPPTDDDYHVPRHAQTDGVSETIAALRLAAQFKKAPEIAGPATDLLDALEGYQP